MSEFSIAADIVVRSVPNYRGLTKIGMMITYHNGGSDLYRIYPAIRRDFCPSRMTSNN